MKLSRFFSPLGFGAILLMAVVSVSSCKKDEPNDPNPEVPFFIQFEVNGSTVRYEEGVDEYGGGPGKHLEWTTNLDSSCCTWASNEYTLFSKPNTEPDYLNNSIIIEMVEFFNDSPTFNDRFNIWDISQKTYGTWNEDSLIGSENGAIFTYTDNTGKVWSSDLVFGNQDGSAFEVTGHKAVSDELHNAISQGTFNCKFRDGLGDSLMITNGEFKARTIQDQ